MRRGRRLKFWQIANPLLQFPDPSVDTGVIEAKLFGGRVRIEFMFARYAFKFCFWDFDSHCTARVLYTGYGVVTTVLVLHGFGLDLLRRMVFRIIRRQHNEVIRHHPVSIEAHGAGDPILLDQALNTPLSYALALCCFFGADRHGAKSCR